MLTADDDSFLDEGAIPKVVPCFAQSATMKMDKHHGKPPRRTRVSVRHCRSRRPTPLNQARVMRRPRHIAGVTVTLSLLRPRAPGAPPARRQPSACRRIVVDEASLIQHCHALPNGVGCRALAASNFPVADPWVCRRRPTSPGGAAAAPVGIGNCLPHAVPGHALLCPGQPCPAQSSAVVARCVLLLSSRVCFSGRDRSCGS